MNRQKGNKSRTLLIEALEPRILFSADLLGGAAESLATEDSLASTLEDTVAIFEQQRLVAQQQDSENNIALSEAEVTPTVTELLFVDSRTPDYQLLISDLAMDDSRQFEVVFIGAEESGLQVISDTLTSYQDVEAVHLVSHGSAGEVTLGSDILSQETLADHSVSLSSWQESLAEDADLLLYGCDLAASVEGVQLVDSLALLTGTDVAASVDLTGSSSQGGDWDLEYTSGSVETNVAFGTDIQQQWSSVLANTAPVLAGANDLTDIDEDPLSNSGASVADLIAGQVTDPDPDASGIAVVAVDNSNGTWEYSTDSGTSWTAFGSPDISSALLLADDGSTYVRFVPDADWNGTVTDGISFHAWDQTSGIAGGTADLSPTTQNLLDEFSNPPSYDNNHGTETWSGSWMENDSAGPVNVNTGNFSINQETLEIVPETTGDWIYRQADLTGAISASLSFSYDNSLSGAQQVDLQVSEDGGLTFTTIESFTTGSNTGTGTILTDITAYIADGLQVRFYVETGENGNPNDNLRIDDLQIEFTRNDAVGGATAFSSDVASSDITVNPVNDLPVGLPVINGTVTEDQTLSVDTTGISDVDGLGSFSYQWLRNGSVISGATGTSYLLGDADVGTQISVQVSYSDGHSTSEMVTSVQTAAVGNVNDLPVGLPVINGTVTEDQTLNVDTSGITDDDGLGSFSYQWLRNGSVISGATGTSYLLGDADVGTQISVQVSYSDGHSTSEMVTSVQTAAVVNVNDLPVGLPVINGTVTENQTLNVDTSGIADDDGLGSFSYQWLRDGSVISGATGTSYLLGDADVGTQISVQVSYSDGHSTTEMVTSVQTAAVVNVNDLPVGLPVINGTVTEDQTLSVDTSGITDDDGLGSFSYQWLRNGSVISGATGTSYLLGDADVGTQISVQVSYSDGHSTSEMVTSVQTAAVGNVNDLPVGLPVINGTVTEDQTLNVDTSGIADDDGLGSFSYQWLRNGSVISGATGTSYLLGDADVGTQISVQVSYSDGHSTSEMVTSVQTAAVVNVNDLPVGLPVINGTVTEDQTLNVDTSGIADDDGLGSFSYQWLRDGSVISGATGTSYLLGDADVGTQISVQVSYSDGHSTSEMVTSVQTAAVGNVNDLPVGLPVINGTVTEDQTLSVDTSGITDDDGLGSFSYQWLRNGSVISGATGTSYLLGDADVGTQISVQVSYSDGHSTDEVVTSVQTAAVGNVNDLPVGLPVINGTVTEDQTLSVDTSGIADDDGLGSFNYQWLRNGSAISGANSAAHQLDDADVGNQISIEVAYTDANGTDEMLLSGQTAAVNNINDLPVGRPAISGVAQLDHILMANTSPISDDDGLGSFSYQWLRDGSAISGAENSTYQLQGEDLGAKISVQVSYVDAFSASEMVTSVETPPVANVPVPDEGGDAEETGEEEEEPAVEAEEVDETTGDFEEENPQSEQTIVTEESVSSSLTGTVVLPEVETVSPLDSVALLSVVTDVSAGRDPYEYQEQTIEPIPPKTIDLRNLDIASYSEYGNESVLVNSVIDNRSFVAELDVMKLELDSAVEDSEARYQLGGETAIGITMSISAWFAIWMFRAGSLLACCLSVLPLWTQLDPLPVLGATKGKKDKQLAEDSLSGSGSGPEDDRVDELFRQQDSD
ncbi:DUF4347 domain-containing protein [Amphritea sp. HPY]|uniref:DUF4347 domain-containing protein n=1 Tax=Amphritea sp. HPY TaxID=3421652 RepID=UPI003D7DDEE1